MDPILALILPELTDPQARFVFPSQTAAALWARRVCFASPFRSVASDRFLAWDRFKERALSRQPAGKKPVSAPVRRLFAQALVRRNAASPALRSLIPPEFAESGDVFAPSIAQALPSLAYWEARRAAASAGEGETAEIIEDDEDRDLGFIKTEYAAFLEAHSLFEPSWEKSPLEDRETRYLVFFPEALEDYPEYREILASPGIRLVHADEAFPGGDAPGDARCLILFDPRLDGELLAHQLLETAAERKSAGPLFFEGRDSGTALRALQSLL